MCGILGYNWADASLMKKGLKILAHRGPDGFGVFSDKGVTFGHRRLAIIDLSRKGKQPMSDPKEEVWITYNGEIYNFEEIREELESKGHKFRSDSDTEVIIHGYKEWGVRVLQKLNGMFAFCIYDKKKKQFFAARDRLGIKPFFYYWNGSKFIFSSELKGILGCEIERNVNPAAVKDFLTFGFITGKNSIIKGVTKLLPGEYLLLKGKNLSVHKYWSTNSVKKTNESEDFYIKKIREHLDASVKRRLIADVPVGAFLSGGVDSSAIVATIKKFKPDLKTFSIGFEHKEFNESVYAKKVARELNTEHYEIPFTEKDVLKYIPTLTHAYDEPFADPSMIPTYLVSSVARKHVTVSLSGDGGDELFGGYERYVWYNRIKWYRHTPAFVTKYLFRPVVGAGYALTKAHLLRKGLVLLEGDKVKNYELYGKTLAFTSNTVRDKLAGKQIKNPFQSFAPYFKNESGDSMLNCDLNVYLPDDILTKLDRASMATSLEGRVPFLDHTFAEFAIGMPFHMKVRRETKKYILKKALKDRVSKDILYRKKQGFGVPLKHYFRSGLKNYMHDKLLNKDAQIKEFVNQNEVRQLYEKHQSKHQDNNYILWGLLMFQEWLERWA